VRAVALLLAGCAVSVAAAQAPQPAKPPEQFEVASIRRNPGTGFSQINTQPGGRFIVSNFSLYDVITVAFGISGLQLVDVPRWVQVEKYDITATTGRDEYLSVVAMRPLIQRLLAERFQLEVSRERREIQAYALVRLRPNMLGPQLTPSTADCSTRESRDLANPKRCGTGVPIVGIITGIGSTSAQIANTVGAFIGTFVDDETGLTGRFDISLKWTPNLAADAGAADGVSIFTAVQEQLGLRLEPRRKMIDVIAITRIERPTDN
jgi:uncharacterized protein (TIGR03435 family)